MVAPHASSAPSSISVWAEMLTLGRRQDRDDENRFPVERQAEQTAVAIPPAIGSTTPPTAAQKATFPTRRISARSVSSPATNMSRMTPTSRDRGQRREGRRRMERTGLGGGKQRPEHVQHRRAEDQAGKDLTEYRRLPDSVRQRAGKLSRRRRARQNQQQLQ